MSRAKYITGTVKVLQSKPGGGVEWLASLRKLDLQSAIEALTTLPGVGPKVAACIALFSLDQHHAVPVDTHVWKVTLFILWHKIKCFYSSRNSCLLFLITSHIIYHTIIKCELSFDARLQLDT